MRPPLTFTLDLEDHRERREAPARYPAITREILPWLTELGVRGTFFVVGEVAAAEPGLIREVAAGGHEIALHSWDHKPLTAITPARFRDDTVRGRALLEDLIGQAVQGYRAPIFSLTPASRWAVGILAELGFHYSSSVLAARHPLYGYPGLPTAPFQWPEGLLEIPAPLARLGPSRLPYLGGFYLRYLPLPLIQWLRERAPHDELPWAYCHPYDFDVDEAYTPMRDAAWWVSVLLWCRRRGTRTKLAKLLADGCAPPFAEQLTRGDFARAARLA
jgi:polysaccharide deacetylase family protein (PEP-CTERM system associated)